MYARALHGSEVGRPRHIGAQQPGGAPTRYIRLTASSGFEAAAQGSDSLGTANEPAALRDTVPDECRVVPTERKHGRAGVVAGRRGHAFDLTPQLKAEIADRAASERQALRRMRGQRRRLLGLDQASEGVQRTAGETSRAARALQQHTVLVSSEGPARVRGDDRPAAEVALDQRGVEPREARSTSEARRSGSGVTREPRLDGDRRGHEVASAAGSA